jgi:integrase/recombinase XerC
MREIPTPQLIKIPDPSLGLISPARITSLEENRKQEIWEDFLRIQLKPRTRQEYGKAIDYFCRSMAPDQSPTIFLQEFLASHQHQALQQVLEYRQRSIEAKLSASTINLRLSAIKALVDYARKRGACSFSLADVKALKANNYQNTRGVPVEDYRSILALVDRSTDLGVRDYAILRLLWDNALRREEVIAIDTSDYLPQEGRLMILGKGQIDKQSIDLHPGTIEALDEWLRFRSGLYFAPKNGNERNTAMFLSCNGLRLRGSDVAYILKGYADAAGVKISPHRVRHSAITAYLDASDGDVRSAQSLSRHKDPRTLMIYDDNRHGLQGKATKALGDLLDSSESEC